MGATDHSDCPEVVEIVGRDGRRSDISVWVRDPSTGCVAAVSEHLSAAERMDSLSVLLAREGETRSYVVATGPQDACEAAAHDVSPALAEGVDVVKACSGASGRRGPTGEA